MSYTERMKLALTYAEESSKRARWIVFILQLAVIVVIASLWQQADHNWLQQRLYAAQDLVRVLSCKPEAIYGERAVQKIHDSLHPDGSLAAHIDAEYLDSQYSCQDVLNDEGRLKRAQNYQKDWEFSLVEAKKNVADLQQLMVNRVLGVSFPVLGVVFDVNDLSLLAGVTFAILLSWFYFALQRQKRNVTHVFNVARKADLTGNEPGNCLSAAYHLLAMTQVLTVPPAEEKEAESPTLFKKVSRLSNLIMWTAVAAEVMVVIDDALTMARGSVLNPIVNATESSLAVLFLIYIIFRTSACYRLMTDTQKVWNDTYIESRIAPETRRATAVAAKSSPEVMPRCDPSVSGEKVRIEVRFDSKSETSKP